MSQWYAGVLHPITDTDFRILQFCVAAAKQQEERGEVATGANADEIVAATGFPMGVVFSALQGLRYHRILLATAFPAGGVAYRPNVDFVVEPRAEAAPGDSAPPAM